MPPYKNKRWLLLVLMLIFAIALTACGGDDDGDNDNNGGESSDNGGSDNTSAVVTANLGTGTIAVTIPNGWVSQSEDGGENLRLASSDAAMAKTARDNSETVASGEIAALVWLFPSGGSTPLEFFEGMRAAGGLPVEFTGDSEEVTIGAYSGVRAPASNPFAEGWAYFVATDESNILIIMAFAAPDGYNDDVDSIIRGIIGSAEVTAPTIPDSTGGDG